MKVYLATYEESHDYTSSTITAGVFSSKTNAMYYIKQNWDEHHWQWNTVEEIELDHLLKYLPPIDPEHTIGEVFYAQILSNDGEATYTGSHRTTLRHPTICEITHKPNTSDIYVLSPISEAHAIEQGKLYQQRLFQSQQEMLSNFIKTLVETFPTTQITYSVRPFSLDVPWWLQIERHPTPLQITWTYSEQFSLTVGSTKMKGHDQAGILRSLKDLI